MQEETGNNGIDDVDSISDYFLMTGNDVESEPARILASADSGVTPLLSRYGYRFVKRAFDLVVSLASVVVLLFPSFVLCVAICIKSPGAGPLYSQLRVGRVQKDGSYRLFRMWKFRSMIPDADQMLGGLKGKNEADGPLFKMRNDPRIIPGIGRFIRKHSLDELPQLINVIKGDMSLIGPRPALPGEVLLYDDKAKERLRVKCGCGGPWQAGCRNEGSFEEMVALDLMYAEKRSVKYDIQHIASTVKAMIIGNGAY